MANEILRRNPTSTGNRRVFTWASWVKVNKPAVETNTIWYVASSGASEFNISINTSTGGLNVYDYSSSAYQYQYFTSRTLRDFSNWFHLIVAVDTTQTREDDRFKIYINGVLYNGTYSIAENVNGGINYQTRMNTPGEINYIGQNVAGGVNYSANCQLTDLFLVDGQALTPDIFGFHKDGKGYISVGSTSATDFRPGQWVPKSPRIIKAEINRRGGFGVNGFYLPMNSSNNFGADFHCTPDTILRLKEALPQPKAEIDGSGDYTNALRDDPFKQHLVLAIPFVSGGLQNGFGDYSAAIRGSGSPKTITVNGSLATSNTVSLYYGSSAFLNNGGTSGTQFLNTSHSDYALGLQDFTIECWIYPTLLYNYWTLLSTRPNDGSFADAYHIGTDASGSIGVYSNAYDAKSSNGVINVNQWSHIAAVRTGSTLTLYLNGVAVALNTNYTKNLTRSNLTIGRLQNLGTNLESATGYIQDLRIYKGVAKYTGGFDVPRPYTPVGIATWRAVFDTTANNFCTWNPLYPAITGSNSTYANGNLTVSDSTSNGSQVSATIGVSTGKWYYEARATNVTTAPSCLIGIRPAEWFTFNAQNRTSYRSSGEVFNDDGTTIQSGTTYTTGDIIGVAFDMNSRRLWFSKNGSWVYNGDPNNNSNPATSFGSTSTHYTPTASFDNQPGTEIWDANFGQNPTFSGNTAAGTFPDSNGKGLFKYQPPAGFLALCEDNLPKPAIEDPGKHFKTVLWTGSGTYPRNISGVGFTPDLVWVKNRNVSDFHRVYDSVRGVKRAIYTNSTQAEQADNLISFDSDGFSFETDSYGGGINDVGEGHVAWCWKAGNTTQTNTNGTVTSTVSVNQTAGFSIVSYIGNGTAGATIGHGLGKTPSFIIIKDRTSGSNGWPVYHKSTGNTIFLYLNTTSGSQVNSTAWNNTSPISNVFTVGTGTLMNTNGNYYIAYCWAEIEGYSKFGSYVGNGSADGPFVYCGFKPAFVMRKIISGTGSWEITDNSRSSTNPASRYLYADLTLVETDYPNIDFLSNGFKCRTADTGLNSSGSTYIFVAFAESPFQTTNAK